MTATSEVLIANESFYAAFRARDLAAMESVWAEEVAITCIHPGWNAIEGREEVLGSWAAILRNPNAPRVRCHAPQAYVHGGAALVICYEVLEGAVLVATNAFVRQGGAWRMVHHQAGPAGALPDPAAAPPRVH
jgi:ketosteroid isomerase-like protein